MDPTLNMDVDFEMVIEGDEKLECDETPAYSTLTSISMEMGLDEVLKKLHEVAEKKSPKKKKSSGTQKKRGRKPIRPLDPVKKKTEEKDKYWLRTFRKYIKETFPKFSDNLTAEDHEFWTELLSPTGVPEKNNQFSSYGKKYKNYLFCNYDFVCRFQQWFLQFGEKEISKKYEPSSDLWFVFYDYGIKELFHYVPRGCSSMGSLDTPNSFSLSEGQLSPPDSDKIGFCMVDAENDKIIETFLNQV